MHTYMIMDMYSWSSGWNLTVILQNRYEMEYIYIFLVGRVFANGPGDMGSIPVRIIPKTLRILLNVQHYKVRINCKVEQSRERSSSLPYTTL